MKINTKGGARPGAGRPAKAPSTKITLVVENAKLAELRAKYGKGLNKKILQHLDTLLMPFLD